MNYLNNNIVLRLLSSLEWKFGVQTYNNHIKLAKMPVKRGHVAPQNTYIDTIIRKFDSQRNILYHLDFKNV